MAFKQVLAGQSYGKTFLFTKMPLYANFFVHKHLSRIHIWMLKTGF